MSPEDWNNLRAVQEEITRWASGQFPHRTDHHAIYKLMVHEIPELAMHRKEKGTEDIGPELGDCFILLLDLASLWGVDVVEAIRSKMEINYGRIWEMDVNGIMQHIPVVDDFVVTRYAPPDDTTIGCPSCYSDNTARQRETDSPLFKCLACGHVFDDDIPF